MGVLAVLPQLAEAESAFVSFSVPSIPNYAGAGIGGAPDYVGSQDYFVGGAPFFRLSRGERFVQLDGNYLSINPLDHPNIRLGPAGLLRLGRNDVENDAVDELPSIKATIELGAFASYSQVSGSDPRDRWSLGVNVTQDVLGEHGGALASVSARGFFGIGRFAVGGLALAASWGSEGYMDTYFSVPGGGPLPRYEAGAGIRDARLQAIVVQPLSPRWVAGGGFQYQRLLGEAADSPIVDREGSADQWIFGLGVGRIW